jgi:hypothetical protein
VYKYEKSKNRNKKFVRKITAIASAALWTVSQLPTSVIEEHLLYKRLIRPTCGWYRRQSKCLVFQGCAGAVGLLLRSRSSYSTTTLRLSRACKDLDEWLLELLLFCNRLVL